MKADLNKRILLSAPRLLLIAIPFILLSAFLTQDENATGKLIYKTKSKSFELPLKYAQFISGPDTFDHKKIIRRLVFSGKSMAERFNTCETMRCPDQFIEGIQVDLDAARKVLYWVVLDNQRVQYSGTTAIESLELTTNTANRITGKIIIDDSAAGGPVLNATFDAPLLKAYTKYE